MTTEKMPATSSDRAQLAAPATKKTKKKRPQKVRDLVSSMVFAIPFLAVTATNLRNTVAMCAALFVILLPVSALRFLLQEQLKTPQWVAVPVCSLVSLMLASLSYYIIRFVSVEITDALGVYLYLLAAYPVLSAASSEQGIRDLGTALAWGMRYFARFCFFGLPLALIRELLAYGQIWGISLGYTFRLDGAKMTFFGLLLMGVMMAATNQIRALRRRKQDSLPPLEVPPEPRKERR